MKVDIPVSWESPAPILTRIRSTGNKAASDAATKHPTLRSGKCSNHILVFCWFDAISLILNLFCKTFTYILQLADRGLF